MKKLFIYTLAVLLNIVSVSAQNLAESGFQYFKIGDIEAVVISDGYIPFPSVQPIIAPNVNTEEVSSFLKAQNLPTTNIDFALNILLLKKGDRLILLDSGVGEAMNGHLLKNLQQIGITPNQITDIIISHAHFDHVNGLFDKDKKLAYTNAQIHLSKIEYDFWVNETPDFSKSKFSAKDAAMMSTEIKAYIEAARPQLNLLKDGEALYDSFTIDVVPGHTKGHATITISSAGEQLVCISDLVHHTMLLTHPRWGISFDWDFDLGIRSRVEKLKEYHNKNALLFGFHLPYPGVGRLSQLSTDSYQWQPQPFASPYKK